MNGAIYFHPAQAKRAPARSSLDMPLGCSLLLSKKSSAVSPLSKSRLSTRWGGGCLGGCVERCEGNPC